MNYLSRFRVANSAMAQHGLWDSYAWHQAIWDIFPGREHKKRDFLFRLDSMRNNTRLLLLSPVPPILPEWGEGSTKKISSAFLGHNAYQFQLKANPVKRLRETGKRVGIYCEEELVNWIHRKGETGGFEIFQEYLNVSPPMAEYFNRNGRKGKHISVDFSGVLQVRNPQHFENAFYNGIGPAKAFGFGMLMLQPI